MDFDSSYDHKYEDTEKMMDSSEERDETGEKKIYKMNHEEERALGRARLDSVEEVGQVIGREVGELYQAGLAAKVAVGLDPRGDVKDFDPSKEKADGGGARFSEGKNMVDLIRPLMAWGLANVFTRGSFKYAANNWMRGMEWREVLGPLERHVLKWKAGEVYDKDTGCHHMFMVAWNALVLAFYQLVGLGDNNLGVDFDHEFTGCVREIEAFDLVNNKSEEQYKKELEEIKKKKGLK